MVGAGISGLAAAWTLAGDGRGAHEVTVLEAGDEAGGRMRSAQVGDRTMELGAQFLSSHYEVVPGLAAAVGLTTTSIVPGTGVVQHGTLRHFRSDRPSSQFAGGVLPWRAGPRAAAGMAGVRRTSRHRSTGDLTQWTDHDDERGDDWASRVLGPAVADRVLAPTVNGFYFQSLAASSAALPAAVSAFGARPGSALTITGGLGQLTRRLADHLDVRLRTPVTAVRREGEQVRVTTPGSDEVVDRVVLAVPGAAARSILVDATEAEQALMATPYSRGLLVGVPLSEPLGPHQLGSAYGVLVHPDEPTPVAAVAVASRADPGAGTGDLLTVMLDHAAATELHDASHTTVVGVATEALLGLDPSLAPLMPTDSGAARVVRHDQAMPTCPPGHAARVAAYRHGPPPGPVVLAGDYLGFPWTDSAAATGVWAARAASS